METSPTNREPWIPALSRAGWELVVDRVIHGLCHDFTGRASALRGLHYLMEEGDPDAATLTPLLAQEVESLDRTIGLLRLLPDDSTGADLLAPGEVLESLARLVRSQRGLEDVDVTVEIGPGAPAVRIDRTLFIRSLLLLLTGAAEGALLEGGRRIVVRGRSGSHGLILEIAPFPEAGKAELAGEGILPRQVVPMSRMREVARILATQEVGTEEFQGKDGARALRLTYPSASSP